MDIGTELSTFPRIIVPTSSGLSNSQTSLNYEDEGSIILSNVSNYHRHDVLSKNIWIFIWPILLISPSFLREALNFRIYTLVMCQMKTNIVKNFKKQSKPYRTCTSVQYYSIFYQFHESEIFLRKQGSLGWSINVLFSLKLTCPVFFSSIIHFKPAKNILSFIFACILNHIYETFFALT